MLKHRLQAGRRLDVDLKQLEQRDEKENKATPDYMQRDLSVAEVATALAGFWHRLGARHGVDNFYFRWLRLVWRHER